MLSAARKLWQRGRSFLPNEGFLFGRPIVVLQSDDWGRVGLRDKEGLEELRAGGLKLGEHPYDFYTLETADDLMSLKGLLKHHRDSTGRPACLGMNFIVANVDFTKVCAGDCRHLELVALADGLPKAWKRPALFEAYREGISGGVFVPALHGLTHFCRRAVERHMAGSGEHIGMLRTLWRAGTPYIHWRMPWIGYEYWEPEVAEEERFLSLEVQTQTIAASVAMFFRLFSTKPRSACAPGYRANAETHRIWSQHDIRVAQNGPGPRTPPHFDRYGILHLSRNIEFEPAVDPQLSVEACLQEAEFCFFRGIPAIVSLHSINFHSSVKDYRSQTLGLLDQFLAALESKHPDLLYLNDHDLFELVTTGALKSAPGIRINITKRNFLPGRAPRSTGT